MYRRISRRELVLTASTLAAGVSLPNPVSAQEATPVAESTPETDLSLNDLVAGGAPESLLTALRSTAVTTSLFPASYGVSMVSAWDDDSDLEGSLGGALVGGEKAPLMLAFVVYPDAEAAAGGLENQTVDSPEPPVEARILGQPGLTFPTMFGPRTLLQVERVLIWGFGMPILTDPEMDDMSDKPDFAYRHLLETRSVLHATIGLDHLRRVVTG